MTPKHLSKGSQQPPNTNILRLYSMHFCPFAQRARLVLKAKEIEHEIVNIDLFEKPEWYSNVHPEGKVPALDTGSDIIVESLDICDYLDAHYPENPLYPSDPEDKQQDKDLIQKIGPVVGAFSKCLFGQEEKAPKEWLSELLPTLEVFENELCRRGTPFFGGEKPGMVDYMLWPWAERAGCVALKLGQKLPVEDGQLPLLRKWRKTMRTRPEVDEIYIGPERFWKIAECKLSGTAPDYENV